MKRTFEQKTLGDSKTVPQTVATIISLMGEGKSADEIAHALPKDREELIAQISFHEDGSPFSLFSFLRYMIETREYTQYHQQKPEEVRKLVGFLLECGITVSYADLQESREFARMMLASGKKIHWKLPGTNYFFKSLLDRLIELKAALPEIADILETKEAGKLLKMEPDPGTYIGDIMNSAFEWLSTDRAYANGLIDLLSRHGVGLTPEAIKIDAQRALQLVGNFPDQPLLKDPVKGGYLLTYSIRYCKNPIEMLKILMDTPREKQILAIFKCRRDPVDWADPLVRVLNRMNANLSLDQCLELIDFLLAKGQPLLPDHFTFLKSRSKEPAQQWAISVVIMRHFFRVMKLSPSDVSCVGTSLSVMEYLIGIKYPFSELKKILDFAKSQSWNAYFKINLVFKIFGLELLRTLDSDNNETYVLSLLELLLDHGFSPDLIFRQDDIFKRETASELAVRLIHGQRDMGKIEKLLTVFQLGPGAGYNWELMLEKLITRLSPVNAWHIEAIFAQLALIPGCWGQSILSRLRARYRSTDDQMLKNSFSGMIAGFMDFHKPVGEWCPISLQESISSAFQLRQETRYYFESLPTVITGILFTVFPQVLIKVVSDYLTPASLVSAMASFTPSREQKDMRYKLAVRRQAPDSSDCGAHAFTNALLGAAFITGNAPWWAAIQESKPFNFAGEDKGVNRTLLENTRQRIIDKAVRFRQGDNDTSPVVMRELIERDDSKLIKVIRDFNQADPTLVPINTEKPEGAYIGTFEASAQLQMLNNMIRIFDRLQKGQPVGGYPFLIFLQNHWITALCFGRLFLICDSYDDNPNYLSAVCRPIQEAITEASALKALCKTVLAQAYAEFTFFQEKEIKSPEGASRQITGLFQVWLSIASNVHLRSVLETGDVLKFKRALDLSRALKEWGADQDLTDRHSSLASKILKNPSLFSRETKYFPIRFKISEPYRDNRLAIS